MKIKKGAVLIGIIVCTIAFVSIALFIHAQGNISEIPDEVKILIEEYMAAYREGTEKSAEFIHFNDEFKRQAYIVSGDKLLDYEIQSIERINDNLYALNILVKTIQTEFYKGDDLELVYNFAAKIDGQWKYINGVSNIPEDLRENLNISKYTYQDENILG